MLFIREYSLKRRTVRQGDVDKADDVEKADENEKAESDDDVKTIEGVRFSEKKGD